MLCRYQKRSTYIVQLDDDEIMYNALSSKETKSIHDLCNFLSDLESVTNLSRADDSSSGDISTIFEQIPKNITDKTAYCQLIGYCHENILQNGSRKNSRWA